MKKLLYSLLTLAAALTVTSCLKEVEGGSAAYDDGTLVDATFSVTLGPQTKAFADGTTVDKLYAGIYEIGANDAYTWKADNADAPAAISGKAATVEFTGKIQRGKSYRVVFWAQKQEAPYTIDWAKTGNGGPTIKVTVPGDANDELRDAFYGFYDTGVVTKNITAPSQALKRPFAQVNVLVPMGNFNDPTAAITSSMTVSQAPTKLNLATGATTEKTDWTFNSATIGEDAFGSYLNTHKYVAMNYVLVDQAAAGSNYDVKFTVNSAATAPQTATDRQVKNAPLKANVRTNIIGNVFDENFNLSIPITIDPNTGPDEDIRPITITVGGNSVPAGGVNLASGATSVIQLAYSAGDTPTIEATSDNEDAVKIIDIDANNKTVTVKGFNDGVAIITITVGAGTKSGSYIATSTSVKYIVGTPAPAGQVATPTFSPAAGTYTEAKSVEISCETVGATIHYTVDGTTPTAESAVYSSAIAVGETMTIKAIAVKGGMENSEVATAEYIINIPLAKVATPTFSPAAGTYDAAQNVVVSCATDGASIYYTTDGTDPTTSSTPYNGAIAVGETMTIKAIAVKEGMTNSEIATAAYTISLAPTYSWSLVTNASSLSVGDVIVIANEDADKALGTTQNTNNRAAVDFSATNVSDNVQQITLVTGSVNNTFAFQVGADSYLYAASSSSNNMKTGTLNDNASWSISISEGVATITANGTNTRNLIRYNPNNNNPIFSCYASNSTTGSSVKIYKRTN